MVILWICKFVNNKQMTSFQMFVSQQLLFFNLKHLDTMSNVTDFDFGQTNLLFYDIDNRSKKILMTQQNNRFISENIKKASSTESVIW